MSRPYTLRVYKAADGWRWRMKAPNGRTVADSGEAYVSHAGAERAALSVATARIVVAGARIRFTEAPR